MFMDMVGFGNMAWKTFTLKTFLAFLSHVHSKE